MSQDLGLLSLFQPPAASYPCQQRYYGWNNNCQLIQTIIINLAVTRVSKQPSSRKQRS